MKCNKSNIITALVLSGALLSPQMAAAQIDECTAPAIPPSAPDGTKATEKELVDAVGVFRAFQTDAAAYRECLLKYMVNIPEDATDDERDDLNEAATPEQIAAQKMFNDSVDAETVGGDDLNKQIRAFKSK